MSKFFGFISFIIVITAVCVTMSLADQPAPQNEPNQPAATQPDNKPNQDPNSPISDPNKTESIQDSNNLENNSAAIEDTDKTEIPTESPLPALYDACQAILDIAVNENGNVNYAMLRRKRSSLNEVMRILEATHPAMLMAMDNSEKQAFWINAYNFCTLKLIVDNYPIQPKWYMILYPNNSIMQITDPWTKNFFKIQGLEYNLEEIRDEMLLQRYKDPRICFALSYATQGGATLRNEPYKAEILDRQLDDQVRMYLAQPKGLKIDRQTGTVFLSNQFNTFRDAFLNSKYAEIKKFRNRKDDERAWLNFLIEFLPEEDRLYLENNEVKFEFIRYDWLLNETTN